MQGNNEKYMRPWKTVDRVYFIMNLLKSHWVLTKIDLVAWTINLYDSGHYVVIDSTIHEVFGKMAKLIPHLMHCRGDFSNHPKVIVGENGEIPSDFIAQCIGNDSVP